MSGAPSCRVTAHTHTHTRVGSRSLGVWSGHHGWKMLLTSGMWVFWQQGGGPCHAPVDPGSLRELESFSTSASLCLGEGGGV